MSGLLDVAVFADTVEEHHSRLIIILKRFSPIAYYLTHQNFAHMWRPECFSGFLISQDGIAANPEKDAVIRVRPIPSTTSEI